MADEFHKNDVLIQIGCAFPCVVIGVDPAHYFVRWFGGGDSMLWKIDVERDYVKVDNVDDEEVEK